MNDTCEPDAKSLRFLVELLSAMIPNSRVADRLGRGKARSSLPAEEPVQSPYRNYTFRKDANCDVGAHLVVQQILTKYIEQCLAL